MDQDSNPNKCLCPRPQDCMSFIVLTWISVVCSIFKSTSKGAPCYILKSNTHFLKTCSVKGIICGYEIFCCHLGGLQTKNQGTSV